MKEIFVDKHTSVKIKKAMNINYIYKAKYIKLFLGWVVGRAREGINKDGFLFSLRENCTTQDRQDKKLEKRVRGWRWHANSCLNLDL